MREERLAQAFVEFSDTLVRDYDVVEFLSRLCQRSVEVLEVTAAGALLTDGARRLQVVAASTEQVTVLETLQIQRQEGPCVDAYRSGRRVAVPDLRRVGRRWPVFTPRALGAGVSGVCAFPMRLRTDRIGALNVFQAAPGSFDQATVLAGQALADVATIAILQARAVEDAARLAGQLQHALESRVVVEQAKGILGERLGIDPEAAFDRLRRHGRQHGMHLATLAAGWWTGRSRSTSRRATSEVSGLPSAARLEISGIPETCRTPQTRRPLRARNGSLGLSMIHDRLSDVLGELSRTLVVAYQIPNALERLCIQLTGMLPVSGCWAVVMDELDGELRFVAASDAVGRKLAALHGELDEGPCLEAARNGERVLVPDLGAPDAVERFPRFAAQAMAGGVSAVHSFPLRSIDQQVGSVGLFNLAPGDLDEHDVELAQLLADLTAASIVGAHRYQQVSGLAAGAQQCLADAAVLEQAKGRLSVQLGVEPDHALGYLQRYLLASGGSVREAAEQVCAGKLSLRRTADGTITRG